MQLTLKNVISLAQSETQIVLIRKYDFHYSLYYYVNCNKMRNLCNSLHIVICVMLLKSNFIIYAFLQLSVIVYSLCQPWIVICNRQTSRITWDTEGQKRVYAAFVHTIWNVQFLCFPTPFPVQCSLMSFSMFQLFAAGIIRW